MIDEPAEALNKSWARVISSVLLFWVGYVAIALLAGFATSSAIASKLWQLTAWGLLSSAGLLALPRILMRIEKEPRTNLDLAVQPSIFRRFSFGVILGAASFGIHVAIVATFAGPIRFEWVPGVGVLAAAIYFARFLSTSCMEELGFRGYPLRRLTGSWTLLEPDLKPVRCG
jgi:membrane protease YdiL (CAAX protease family)